MNTQEKVNSDERLVVSQEAENRPTSRYDRKTYDYPITSWNEFEELELFVKQVTCRQLRKMNFSRMEMTLNLEDCIQVGWLALWEARVREPDIVKGKAISIVMNNVKAYVLRYVFNLIRLHKKDGKAVWKTLYMAWQVADVEEDNFWAEYDMEEVEERGEAMVSPSSLPERVLIAAEDGAMITAQTKAELEQMAESDFLFHQVGRTVDRADLHDGDYPGFEEALVLLFCASHLHHTPSHKLTMDVKRQYAQVLVLRMQGWSGDEIAAEAGKNRQWVYWMIQDGKKHLGKWYSLSYEEQIAAIAKAKLTYSELA